MTRCNTISHSSYQMVRYCLMSRCGFMKLMQHLLLKLTLDKISYYISTLLHKWHWVLHYSGINSLFDVVQQYHEVNGTDDRMVFQYHHATISIVMNYLKCCNWHFMHRYQSRETVWTMKLQWSYFVIWISMSLHIGFRLLVDRAMILVVASVYCHETSTISRMLSIVFIRSMHCGVVWFVFMHPILKNYFDAMSVVNSVIVIHRAQLTVASVFDSCISNHSHIQYWNNWLRHQVLVMVILERV